MLTCRIAGAWLFNILLRGTLLAALSALFIGARLELLPIKIMLFGTSGGHFGFQQKLVDTQRALLLVTVQLKLGDTFNDALIVRLIVRLLQLFTLVVVNVAVVVVVASTATAVAVVIVLLAIRIVADIAAVDVTIADALAITVAPVIEIQLQL